MSSAPGLAFAADGATVAAGAFNAAWMGRHWLGLEQRSRRLAAGVLAVLNAGIATQAAFGQALYLAHEFGAGTGPFFETGPWLASRGLLLFGVWALSLLILRRRGR